MSLSEDTQARLAKLIAAANKRAQSRTTPSVELYTPSAVPASLQESLRFFVSQLAYLEGIGPRNLETLARVTKVPQLQEAYRSQIDDEHAHAQMLRDWLTQAGEVPRSSMLAFGSWAGLVLQRDPWLGAVCIMATIEFLSNELLPVLRERVPEPWLKSILGEIERDEHRHKALAIVAARATREQGLGLGTFNRARQRAAQSMVDLYFEQILSKVFGKHAANLDLPVDEIYERAREDLNQVFLP